MPTGKRIAETLHIVALGVWFGSLVMTGAIAASIFPLMRRLDPTLGAYPDYGGPHWPLAAGHVAASAFTISDWAQLAGFVLAGGSLAAAAALELPVRRWLSAVRVSLFLLLACTLAYQFLVLGPRMQEHLTAYWSAAEAGESNAAEAARQAFASDHPAASRLMGTNAILTLIALVAAVWSVTSSAAPRRPTE